MVVGHIIHTVHTSHAVHPYIRHISLSAADFRPVILPDPLRRNIKHGNQDLRTRPGLKHDRAGSTGSGNIFKPDKLQRKYIIIKSALPGMRICMTFRITEIKHVHHQCIRIISLIFIPDYRHLSLVKMQNFICQSLSLVAIKFNYSPYRATSGTYLKFRNIIIRYTENVFKIPIHILVVIPDLHDHKFLLPFNLFSTCINKNNLRHKFIQSRRKAVEINVSSLSRHEFSLQDNGIALHQRILYGNRRQRICVSSRIRDTERDMSSLIAQKFAGTTVLTCQTERTFSSILQVNAYDRLPHHMLVMEER